MNLAPLVLIFVIFYFLLIRPQQKKAKEIKKMLDEFGKRAIKWFTAGGIYGVDESVETGTVTVKIAENVRVKVNRNSIATIRTGSDQE